MANNLKQKYCTHCGQAVFVHSEATVLKCPHCKGSILLTVDKDSEVLEFDREGLEFLKELSSLTQVPIKDIIKPVARLVIELIEIIFIVRRLK